ncbi:MAG: cupin domain-containing protein [Thermomicrobiales bacterium]
MTLKPPALDPSTVTPRTTSGYPEPYRSRVLPREKRALGDALGLTKIGCNLTTLPPGKESAMRHYHTHEDELVFVVEGEVVLRTDEGEQVLTAGQCAAFPAGSKNGHHFINRSASPVRYLEVSNRDSNDRAVYPDDDLRYEKDANGRAVFARKADPSLSG